MRRPPCHSESHPFALRLCSPQIGLTPRNRPDRGRLSGQGPGLVQQLQARPLRCPARGIGGKASSGRMSLGGGSLPAGALADRASLPAARRGQLEASRPAFRLGLVLPDEAWRLGQLGSPMGSQVRSKPGMFRVFMRGGAEGHVTHQDSGGGPLPPDRGGLLGAAPAVLEPPADRPGAGRARSGTGGTQKARRRFEVPRLSDAQAQELGGAISLWPRPAGKFPPGAVFPVPAGPSERSRGEAVGAASERRTESRKVADHLNHAKA